MSLAERDYMAPSRTTSPARISDAMKDLASKLRAAQAAIQQQSGNPEVSGISGWLSQVDFQIGQLLECIDPPPGRKL